MFKQRNTELFIFISNEIFQTNLNERNATIILTWDWSSSSSQYWLSQFLLYGTRWPFKGLELNIIVPEYSITVSCLLNGNDGFLQQAPYLNNSLSFRGLLCYDDLLWFGRIPTFQRAMLQCLLKCWYPTSLRGVTTQKTPTWSISAMKASKLECKVHCKRWIWKEDREAPRF
jgi:hypothetical protein